MVKQPSTTKRQEQADPIPVGEGEATRQVLENDTIAEDMVLNGKIMLQPDADDPTKSRMIQNKLSAVSSNLRTNLQKMTSAVQQAIRVGKLPADTLDRIQAILSGGDGVLRIVREIEESASLSQDQRDAAQKIVNIAIEDYMEGVQELKTKIEIVIRSWENE